MDVVEARQIVAGRSSSEAVWLDDEHNGFVGDVQLIAPRAIGDRKAGAIGDAYAGQSRLAAVLLAVGVCVLVDHTARGVSPGAGRKYEGPGKQQSRAMA